LFFLESEKNISEYRFPVMGKMLNPFSYGGIATGDGFCGRCQEITDLKRAIENHERLFVFGERRLGKTSLVLFALAQLPKRTFAGAYIDLWPTDGERAFIKAVAKGITQALTTPLEKRLETTRHFFSRLLPSITVNGTGNPTVSFDLKESGAGEAELEEVLAAPARLA
jgi:hypothetical protein